MELVGQSDQARIHPDIVERTPCDVLAVDYYDPQWFPLYFFAENAHFPNFRVLLIGMEETPEVFLEAVRGGVSGYLLKDVAANEVLAAIRSVAKGEAVCPPKLCASLFQSVAQAPRPANEKTNAARAALTIRQRQLMELVAKGLTNKEIAAQLNLSEFTVRNHIHRILKQVDVTTRHEAVDAVMARSATNS